MAPDRRSSSARSSSWSRSDLWSSIEIAPRRGRRIYTVRSGSAACVDRAPSLIVSGCSAVRTSWAIGVGRACSAWHVLLRSTTARQGRRRLPTSSSSASSPPALILAAGRADLPHDPTIFQSFLNSTGDTFVGFDNYVWIFTQPRRLLVDHQHDHLGADRPRPSRRSLGLAYAVLHRQGARREVLKILIFMPIAISFVGAGIIWELHVRLPPQGEQIGILNALVVWLRRRARVVASSPTTAREHAAS